MIITTVTVIFTGRFPQKRAHLSFIPNTLQRKKSSPETRATIRIVCVFISNVGTPNTAAATKEVDVD